MRFIEKNGYIFEVKEQEAIEFMVQVDTKNKSVEEIGNWLKKQSNLS